MGGESCPFLTPAEQLFIIYTCTAELLCPPPRSVDYGSVVVHSEGFVRTLLHWRVLLHYTHQDSLRGYSSNVPHFGLPEDPTDSTSGRPESSSLRSSDGPEQPFFVSSIQTLVSTSRDLLPCSSRPWSLRGTRKTREGCLVSQKRESLVTRL